MRGAGAHAAIPHTGVDAMHAVADVMQALYNLRAAFAVRHSKVAGIDHPTLNIGLIKGGTNTNVVPDRVSFSLDRRMIPEEDPGAVETEIRGAIAQAMASHPGAEVEIRRLLLARALQPLPGVAPLVLALQRHGQRVFGETPPVQAVPLYTDARLYGEAGIPVALFGRARARFWKPMPSANENLRLEDLRGATRVVAAAMGTLLGGPRASRLRRVLSFSAVFAPAGVQSLYFIGKISGPVLAKALRMEVCPPESTAACPTNKEITS